MLEINCVIKEQFCKRITMSAVAQLVEIRLEIEEFTSLKRVTDNTLIICC